jgi:hypothetical protein
MKKNLAIIFVSCLLTGCSGVFLRYSYEPALQSLPDCSKVHAINNNYITYSKVDPKVIIKSDTEGNVIYTKYIISVTNFYKAYYLAEGKIYKTVSSTENAK